MNEERKAVIDKDFLIELRRNAYIECTENFLESNTVVGIFGDRLPEHVFYACGVVPVPIEGVDSHIFKFGKENEGEGFCDVIKSTLIYLTTQKCPILYSCKMYVLENACNSFIEVLKANTKKPVAVYKNDEELLQILCNVYGTNYNETIKENAKTDLDYIKNILTKIKYYSDISTEELFLLEFYSKYMMDLKMRRKYFEQLEKTINFSITKREIKKLPCICPRGNYKAVCREIKDSNTIIERMCDGTKMADYGYANCIFDCTKKRNYEI